MTHTIESSIRTNGPDAGSRRIRILNGLLDIELLPDRGLDVGQVRLAGVPLAWTSPTGFPPLHHGDADGKGWMRAFGGGLVTTCGVLSFGPPSEGEPMHGRFSSLSADVTRTEVTETECVVEATIREVTVFGAHLEVRRRISSPIGVTSLRVDDVIVNRGTVPAEPMVLYHVNLGAPLIGEGARFATSAVAVRPRDDAAAEGLESWATFPALSPTYPEQVFEHELDLAEPGVAEVIAPDGLAVTVRWDSAVLPAMMQWRVAENDMCVLGVEPATTATIRGRADARERGLLAALEPGASLRLGVQIDARVPSG